MGILRRLFPPPRPMIHDEACIEKAAVALKAEHEKTRERIERMKDDIQQATLNGEERWFLQLHKEAIHDQTAR